MPRAILSCHLPLGERQLHQAISLHHLWLLLCSGTHPWPASEGGRVPLPGGGERSATGGGLLQAGLQRWAPLHLASLHPGVGSAAGCCGTLAPVDPMNPEGSEGNEFYAKVSRAWVPRPVQLNCRGAAGLCINCVSCFLFGAILFFKGPRKCLKLSHFAKRFIIPNTSVTYNMNLCKWTVSCHQPESKHLDLYTVYSNI